MSFSTLGLSEELIRAVADQGYVTPTPIQIQAIPAVLAGADILAGAQTGTGKTASFVLPILQRLTAQAAAPRCSIPPNGKSPRRPLRVLILTPTRELAAQVQDSVRVYGKHLSITSAAVYGGVGIPAQIATLKRGVDILVATTGRLLDLHQQRAVDLSKVEILVLDEADRMLDMGFIRDIRRILPLLRKERQNLLFSATISSAIKELADGLLNAPTLIEVARRGATVDITTQRVYAVDRQRKPELLAHLIKERNWFQVLVFTRTKHGADKLAEQLNGDGIKALAMHGNKSQSRRTRALEQFKCNTLQVLVATDIAARGIDIDLLPHVVNYDLPSAPEDYVHRIGRTGRAGAAGEAISLVCVDEHAFLKDIERLIGRSLPKEIIVGFEPDLSIRAQPISKPGQRAWNPQRERHTRPAGTGRLPFNKDFGKSAAVQRSKARGGGVVQNLRKPNGAVHSPSQRRVEPEIGQFAAAVVRGDPMISRRDEARNGYEPRLRGKDVDGNRAQPPQLASTDRRRGR